LGNFSFDNRTFQTYKKFNKMYYNPAMPTIELSSDNLSRLDAIRQARGISREDALEQALEAAQYAHLDEATRNAILNAPITTWEEFLEGTDPDAPEFDIPAGPM
jgi:predicted transcriptional regulator